MTYGANEKKRILVIDDDTIFLTTAELFLKDEYEMYKANSGEEAMKLLNDQKIVPHLIMLDILMPNMDGWQIYNKLKALNDYKEIPVVFLTSMNEETEKKRAQKIGAADYITKPFNLTDLRSRIKKIILSTAMTNKD
ncbi:MAG: response regulator [Spirochaetaceae bacterium]|jgi:DNA-binding response OmpR family regulator|nr:response regulator [Spirochaetaceae bacterium]